MPTKSDLESALRNADKAGDIDAARQIANALKAGDFSADKTGGESSFLDDAKRGIGLGVRSAVEGIVGLPAAVADLAAYPLNAASRAMTGDPLIPSYRNTLSQGLTDAGLPTPSTNAERVIDATTRGVASVPAGLGIGSLLAGSASPVVAGVGNILQSAPGVQAVAGGSAGASGELARQGGASPEMQQIAALGGGLVGGGIASALSPTASTSARLPAGSATTAPEAAALRTLDAEAERTAQAGALRIGLDWNHVDDGLRESLRNMARQSIQTGSDLEPDAIARAAVYQSVGITPTRALITRNFSDALNEQNLLTAPEGDAIRQIYQQNNQAIRQQIQSLRPEGVQPVGNQAFGERFRAPVAAGERQAQQLSNEAYTAAQAAEGGNTADITRLNAFLNDNAGTLNNRPATAGLLDDFRSMGLMKNEATSAELVPASPTFTLQKLASVRAATNEAWQTAKNTGDTRAAGRLNELRGILDNIEADAGGELYNAYRTLRTAKGAKFENNPLIDKLLSEKKGYYGTAAIEDSEVFDKAILGSSPEQLTKVWPRLQPKARDLTRAQVADWIEQKAFSGQASNERGDVVASAAKLNQSLTQLGPEKTRLIFGARQAERLDTLRNAVREISNPPRGTVPQGSAPKLEFLTRAILGVMRVAARPLGLRDIVEGGAVLLQQGATSRANQAAVNNAVSILAPIPASQQVQPLLQRTIPPSLAGLLEQQQSR
jgi:hypothetical protein